MDSFEELKKRTQEGIAATSNESNMTKQEILLWRDMIKKKLAMQYTTDNYEQKKQKTRRSAVGRKRCTERLSRSRGPCQKRSPRQSPRRHIRRLGEINDGR